MEPLATGKEIIESIIDAESSANTSTDDDGGDDDDDEA